MNTPMFAAVNLAGNPGFWIIVACAAVVVICAIVAMARRTPNERRGEW